MKAIRPTFRELCGDPYYYDVERTSNGIFVVTAYYYNDHMSQFTCCKSLALYYQRRSEELKPKRRRSRRPRYHKGVDIALQGTSSKSYSFLRE